MNPIMIDLGIIKIYWYAFFIFLAVLIGGTLFLRETKKYGIKEESMIDMLFYLIPISIIGARLYFVAFNFSMYKNNLIDIVKIWEGGLAIHGGIIAALIYLFIFIKRKRVKMGRMTDFFIPALLLGQSIGRWGNFFNQEAYGKEVSLKFLQSLNLPKFIVEGMNINGLYYHPTFLYESLWCLLGFILVLFIKKWKYLKIGQLTSIYFVWYGVGRLFIESLRLDSLMLGNFKVAQLTSILMIIIGIILFIVLNRGSKFENQYKKGDDLNVSKI